MSDESIDFRGFGEATKSFYRLMYLFTKSPCFVRLHPELKIMLIEGGLDELVREIKYQQDQGKYFLPPERWRDFNGEDNE